MAPEAAELDMSEEPEAAQSGRIEVIAIFGPTASGKTAVAEAVADRLGTEVVSADALQVYRGIPIVTGQPARPTRLVAIRDLCEVMSVGEYATLAHGEIDALVNEHGVAVIAGGTGLYLRAGLQELRIPPPPDPGARDVLEHRYDEDRAAAHERLAALDPDAAARVHVNDRRRVVRALELAEQGMSLVPERDALWAPSTRRTSLVVGLDLPGDALAERIRNRAEEMLRAGAIDEARAAVSGPISRTAEKALGLRELATLDPAVALEQLVVRTVRYAAYQRKWMRRMPGVHLVDALRPVERIAAEIVALGRGQ